MVVGITVRRSIYCSPVLFISKIALTVESCRVYELPYSLATYNIVLPTLVKIWGSPHWF